MALSNWQVGKFWQTAIRNIGNVDLLHFERFQIINYAVESVITQFYALFLKDYMTSIVVTKDDRGSYSLGEGNFYGDTRILKVTMSDEFKSIDVNKVIVFRSAGVVYIGMIEKVNAADEVVVSAYRLPSDSIVDDVMMPPTNLVSDSILLDGLDIIRAGKLSIGLSSNYVEGNEIKTIVAIPVSYEALNLFNSKAPQNKKTIVYTFIGNEIKMKRGADITAYHTLILTYPRMPKSVQDDNDYLDIPNTAIQLVVSYVRKIVLNRIGVVDPNIDNELINNVKSIYENLNVTVAKEEIEQKVRALI